MINLIQHFQKIVKVEVTSVRVYRGLVHDFLSSADFFCDFFLFYKRVRILADIILPLARIILDLNVDL